MGAFAAYLFARIQRTGFYDAVLHDIVDLLPAPNGQTLLDVGCGPGGLTRLAAAHGYAATGIDIDPAMTARARRTARHEHSPATFITADALDRSNNLPNANIVTATSLLAVMPDRANALQALWRLVLPGGTLMIVETTEHMTQARARAMIADGIPGPDAWLLLAWARARQGRTIDLRSLDTLDHAQHNTATDILSGIVRATSWRKNSQ